MPVSPFRRSTKTETKKTGGRGSRGNWREQWRLPKGGQPAPFVLIDGQYTDPDPDPDIVEVDLTTGQPKPVKVPYYKWLKHRRKMPNKSYPITEACARGWDKHNPQQCAGCAAMDSGDRSVSLSEAYSFGVVHLAYYHHHPLFDNKTGQMVMKKDNSGPFMVDTECSGKACNFCRVLSGQYPVVQQGEFFPQYDPKTLSVVFGARRYMELGKGHLGDLSEWDKQIGSRCGGTAWVKDQQGNYIKDAQGNAIPKGRCNNFLDVDGYACATCGNLLINAEQDPRPLAELEALTFRKYPCHFCQRPTFLKEVNSCPSCGNAVVQGIFDGVLWGQRQGEDQQSHLVLVQYDTLADFESTLDQNTRQLIGKPLQERIAELAKPYEFEGLYKPKSYADMAKRLELNVQQPGAYGPMQGYGQPGFYPQQPGAIPQGMTGPYPPQQGQFQAPPQGYPQQPQQPGYTPYGPPNSGQPGPAPFVAPPKPNFGS